MSMISQAMELLSKLPPGIVNTVLELVKTIAEAPEEDRQEVAKRALMAAASRAGTIAAVDEVLKRK